MFIPADMQFDELTSAMILCIINSHPGVLIPATDMAVG
jgi:hypothetical protein